jgi:L-ascorbate metabolism protein UlaG (beta-lactamase superfamily)
MAGTLTWLGHSCATIRLDGLLVITDPALRSRIFHLRRLAPVDAGTLQGVDVILVSHIHYDHLDLPSLDRLDRGAQVVVPAGAGGLLRRRGFRFVREVATGDEVDLGEIVVRVTHAQHAASRRVGTTRTLADVFDGMGSLGRIDVALLPVAGWGPRLPAGHLDPVRAVHALELIEPSIAVPIHWGTYAPWRRPSGLATPAGAFADLAAKIAPAVDVRILRPGESCELA